MENQLLKNNVVIHFSSRLNVREISQIITDVLKVMGLSVLNREIVKINVRPSDGEYQLVINTVLTTTQEQAIRSLFGQFKYKINWSDFDNFDDQMM